MEQVNIVKWNGPEVLPMVERGESSEFWLAVEVTRSNPHKQPPEEIKITHVFCAQYVNKPVFTDDEGEPDTDDYLVTIDGDPYSAVGWHSVKDHHDFSDYYEPLDFNDNYKLLGWANYIKPKFSLD